MAHHTDRFRARPGVEALEPRWQPAAPAAPTYAVTFTDAVTADNAFTGADGKQYWTVDAGADRYQDDTYERPTAQTYQVRLAADGSSRFAASEYYANLDVVEGKAGFDDTYLYTSVRVAGLTRHTSDGAATTEGLVYQYGFRLAREADGGGGLLVVADQPGLKNPTRFGGQSTFVYRDADGDVGGAGRDVTKQDRPAEVGGNGYERVVAADGRLSGGRRVLWARVSPTDAAVVEFALDYKAVGLTAADLRALPYLEFEANKGLKSPANYAWNDEYTKSEAGSPYRATAGDLSKSEFGTQGLGNVYELDTLRGGPIVAAQGRGSLSGFVSFNNEGQFEPRAGVTLELRGTDSLGNAVLLTAVTAGDGSFSFDEVPAGTYSLVETGANFDVVSAEAGSLGGDADTDADRILNITVGPDDFGTDYVLRGELLV